MGTEKPIDKALYLMFLQMIVKLTAVVPEVFDLGSDDSEAGNTFGFS
ncbi:MAG: hypothetical protein ACLPN1_14195 [Dissulfurispiraceae bacterium]